MADPLQIVAFGDSLTAGYGLPAREAFPEKLQARLTKDGYSVKIVNAGVSGETVAEGLRRLDWSVPEGTDLVIVELGANDMLRGMAPERARAGLATIVEKLQARKIRVVLAGMKALGNWGEPYKDAFEAIYPDLATKYRIPLYPFFLEGVSGRQDLTLPDGIHPNAAGVDVMVAGFAPFFEKSLSAPSGEKPKP